MNPLTRRQTEEIRRLLRERERTLRKEILEGVLRARGESFKEVAGQVSDAGDESVADLLADVGVASIDRDARELREVESALARMLSDRFGACVDCGATIGFARLKASPEAARCRACQGRHERGFAHTEPRSL